MKINRDNVRKSTIEYEEKFMKIVIYGEECYKKGNSHNK